MEADEGSAEGGRDFAFGDAGVGTEEGLGDFAVTFDVRVFDQDRGVHDGHAGDLRAPLEDGVAHEAAVEDFGLFFRSGEKGDGLDQEGIIDEGGGAR